MDKELEHKNSIERLELKDALEFGAVRNVLWRVISLANPFAQTGAQNVEVCNYINGRTDLAKEIIDLIDQASPDHWILMQQENRGENNA